MRLPKPQIRMRTLLLLVLLVALGLAGVTECRRLRRRRDRFQWRAAVFAQWEAECRTYADRLEEQIRGLQEGYDAVEASEIDSARTMADWYAERARESRRVAARPWESDPPTALRPNVGDSIHGTPTNPDTLTTLPAAAPMVVAFPAAPPSYSSAAPRPAPAGK